MAKQVITAMSQSAHDFASIVWPKIQSLGWLDGNLIPVETVADKEWSNQLDMLAGIDAWLIKNGIGLVGIASRIQWRPEDDNQRYPYNTFNIRWQLPSGAKTEYQKRLEAITSDGELIYPYWTCHAYLEQKNIGPLLSIGLVRTKDFIEVLSLGHGYDKVNPSDGKIFRCVSFGLMSILGYKIFTHPQIRDGVAEPHFSELIRGTQQ